MRFAAVTALSQRHVTAAAVAAAAAAPDVRAVLADVFRHLRDERRGNTAIFFLKQHHRHHHSTTPPTSLLNSYSTTKQLESK